MGGSSSSAAVAGGAAAGDKNKADAEFATMMIPHHAQAVAMADLAVQNGTDPKVLALASKIKGAQAPEITRMSGWLTGWGQPVPGADGGSSMGGMAGMGEQTGGMMSDKQISDLRSTKGSAFDRLWLQMMVEHHKGAVAMAKVELTQGANAEAKKLAQDVVDGQSAEIAEMGTMMAAMSG